MSELLFSALPFGKTNLKNRVVMSPLTRSRAIGNIPNDLMAKYYSQRAEAGLIITEGTSPSPNGLGYARIPGLFSQEQVKGWKKVTDAVHKKDGKIFTQIMHTGRVSHAANLPAGAKVLAPSAVASPGQMYTDSQGMQDFPVPQAMNEDDIQNAISEYVIAAKHAIEAGFDGVELHGANGYLIEQFLNLASNKRDDRWGGSIANRTRFAIDVAKNVGFAIGFDKVGIRLSPFGAFNGMTPDSETEALFALLAKELGQLGLVYIHIVDHSSMGAPAVPASVKQKIRDEFKGKIILSGGYDKGRAESDLQEKRGDLVAFGRPFISNPTLVSKLRAGTVLTAPDPTTFYTPGEKGYTDYT